jgi:hypothetical protein
MPPAPSPPSPLFLALPLEPSTQPLPPELQALCDDAWRRGERMQALEGADRMAAFQMCHGPSAYRIFHALQALLPDTPARWLELGSGLGVASCLADALGWAATGLEIEPLLVAEAQALAAAHGRRPQLVRGSYRDLQGGGFVVEHADGSTGRVQLADVDVFFAYPWPAERRYLQELVAAHAQPGALLVFHHGGAQWEVFRRRSPA